MDKRTQEEIISSIQERQNVELPDEFSRETLLSEVEKRRESKWIIELSGAKCKFYTPERDIGMIYHVNVPKSLEGRGIGTSMIQTAEYVVRDETDADTLRTSIGTSNGAMKHVLSNKCGFTIIRKVSRDGIGEVLEAKKRI